MKSNIWPACQFNFEWLDENPTRTLTLDDESFLSSVIPWPGCGLVNIRWMGARILITTTIPQDQQVKYHDMFKERLYSSLVQLGILVND